MNKNAMLFDEVLTSLGQPIASKNPLFEIDMNLCSEHFTKVRSTGKSSILFIIELSNFGIDVHLDGASEVFSWENGDIENNPSDTVKTLIILLTSKIQVDSYGDSYKKFTFKDVSTNMSLKIVNSFCGLLINPFKKSTKFFSAILPIKGSETLKS